MRRITRNTCSLVTVLGLLALSACGSAGSDDERPTTSASPSRSAPPAPPSPSTPPVWPLTGMPAEAMAQRPALAVKIENTQAARPQAGLEQADIVWEELVEGGITRFIAVYHSQVPDRIGPIRSVRPMDPAIVAPMSGLLAYSGGQRPFIDAVAAAGIQSLTEGSATGFSRDRRRRAPHNVYGDPGALWAQADASHTAPPPSQFTYGAPGAGTAATAGAPTAEVTAALSPASKVAWTWDASAAAYLRSDNGKASVAASGVRLQATNVVVLGVAVRNTAYRDPAGNPVPETLVVGSGQGVVAGGGKSIAVTWSKASQDSPIVLAGPSGPVDLEPGTTWVELTPE